MNIITQNMMCTYEMKFTIINRFDFQTKQNYKINNNGNNPILKRK